MHRQQICKQIRLFKKKRFPSSSFKLIEDVNKAGALDFAEYTQWERAFLEISITQTELVQMMTWLQKTDRYFIFDYLRKIVPTTPQEKRDWLYTHKFYSTMIDITKSIVKYTVENSG